jgi:hypothetical protein
MTEYEIASLALEEAAGIRDQAELMQGQVGLIIENISMFITVLFGYLVVAYFLAKTLTRVQVSILNFLYLVIMTFSASAVFSAHAIGIFRRGELLILQPHRVPVPFWTSSGQAALVVIMAIVVAASLWFMREARHPKTA